MARGSKILDPPPPALARGASSPALLASEALSTARSAEIEPFALEQLHSSPTPSPDQSPERVSRRNRSSGAIGDGGAAPSGSLPAWPLFPAAGATAVFPPSSRSTRVVDLYSQVYCDAEPRAGTASRPAFGAALPDLPGPRRGRLGGWAGLGPFRRERGALESRAAQADDAARQSAAAARDAAARGGDRPAREEHEKSAGTAQRPGSSPQPTQGSALAWVDQASTPQQRRERVQALERDMLGAAPETPYSCPTPSGTWGAATPTSSAGSRGSRLNSTPTLFPPDWGPRPGLASPQRREDGRAGLFSGPLRAASGPKEAPRKAEGQQSPYLFLRPKGEDPRQAGKPDFRDLDLGCVNVEFCN